MRKIALASSSGLPVIEYTITTNTTWHQDMNTNMYVLAGSPTTPVEFILTIKEGVSLSKLRPPNTPRFTLLTGTTAQWPAGSKLKLILKTGAVLSGEPGGRVNSDKNGCGALYVEHPIEITNNGKIQGGGGAGGSARVYEGDVLMATGGYGGGGGYPVGPGESVSSGGLYGGTSGSAGTATDGGNGGTHKFWIDGGEKTVTGGKGGAPGQAGSVATSSYYYSFTEKHLPPGQGGPCVQGNSLVTWLATGTRLGSIS